MTTQKSCFIRSTVVLMLAGILTTACTNTDNEQNTQTTTAKKTQETKSKSSNVKLIDSLQANFKSSGIDAKIISAKPIPIKGLYLITAEGMPPFYSDASGSNIIQGQIVSITGDKPVDVSAEIMTDIAKNSLANIKLDEMIIYPAKGKTIGVVYAFTDPTCPYCQKLHEEIPAINAKGIEIRYLAWPRTEDALPVMEEIWCSEDKKVAFDQLMTKKSSSVNSNCKTPVQKHIQLGLNLGVEGTPALFTEDGNQIGGYLTPNDIAKALSE